ncbi:hypothetical protein [Trinickia violacea]|uniref:hypothetical protein n=1 Tax=Trinickia violacea TaxID=2571746 RepID=UPI0020C76E49|nr:hypothetical protein [Trinickia violacea]
MTNAMRTTSRGHCAGHVGALRCVCAFLSLAVCASACAAQAREIRIVSGTYGGSCGAPRGNATADLARQCDGKTTCPYVLTESLAGRKRAACRDDFLAEWTCKDAEFHVAALSPEVTPGSTLVLSCVWPAGAGK